MQDNATLPLYYENHIPGEKNNGLIVDYVGIFRNLQEALAIYGSGPDGELEPGEEPVQEKSALIEDLEGALAAARQFCTQHEVDIRDLARQSGFERIAQLDDAVEKIIVNDDHQIKYLNLAADVNRLFKAILPDERAGPMLPRLR
jgi:type I restriction enzyme R subunit